MVVDQLRSYHLGPALMVMGDGTRFQVRWYPCAPGALPLPFPTFMGSAIWQTRTEWEDGQLGMSMHTPGFPPPLKTTDYVWAPTRYPAPPGQHWHGEIAWFQTGLPASVYAGNQLLGPRTDLCGEPLIDGDGGLFCEGEGTILGFPNGGAVGQGDMICDGEGDVPIVNLIVTKTSPLPVSGPINNYPLGDGVGFRLSTVTNPVVVTGFTGGTDGRMIILDNLGPYPIIIPYDSASSVSVNRVLTTDGYACRVYRNMSCWLQYDGTSQRWREVNTVPIVRSKGDILTATDSGPVRLPVSTTPDDVLTADPSQDTGMRWGPVPNSGGYDLNHFRQTNPDTYGARYYLSTFANPHAKGFMNPSSHVIYAMPFIDPRGRTIDQIALWCEANTIGTDVGLMGIYDSIADGDYYPNNLLYLSSEVAINTMGLVTYDEDFQFDASILYWFVCAFRNAGSAVIRSFDPAIIKYWPLFGVGNLFDQPTSWIQLQAARDWDDTLPLVFPAGGALVSDGAPCPMIGVKYKRP